MLVYKCDGHLFSTRRKCSNEVTSDLPEWWLTISGKIKNGLHDAHYIEANGTYHFCSKGCLENFLFKDLNATSATTGNSSMNIEPNVKTEGQEEEVKAPTTETEQEQVPAPAEGEGTEETEG